MALFFVAPIDVFNKTSQSFVLVSSVHINAIFGIYCVIMMVLCVYVSPFSIAIMYVRVPSIQGLHDILD